MRFFVLMRTLLVWALLAGATVYFSCRSYEVWFGGDPVAGEDRVPETTQTGRRLPGPRVPRSAAYLRPAPPGAYEVIPQRNLFSRDRSEGVAEAPASPSVVLPTRPMDSRFALFGVVFDGDRRKALVANLEKRNAADPDEVWVKAGDALGSLTIVAVDAAQIAVSDGTSTHVVRLSERSPWKQPGGARPARVEGKVQTIEVGRPGEKAIRPQGAAVPPAGASQK